MRLPVRDRLRGGDVLQVGPLRVPLGTLGSIAGYVDRSSDITGAPVGSVER